MTRISFTKAHGCGNDFLLVAGRPTDFGSPERLARAICDRHYGVGADGLYFVETHAQDADAEIHLHNSDGSAAELSGNGARCAAAWLVAQGVPSNPLRIRTGAGLRELRLLDRDGQSFRFEMALGRAEVSPGPEGALAVWVGNPYCVVFVQNFDFDWRRRGAELEGHPHFPQKANVAFVQVLEKQTLETRFWERGAGWTLASGTGAVAAVAAALDAGWAQSPAAVRTEGGILEVRYEDGQFFLTGPAEIIGTGEFYWRSSGPES